MSVKSGATSPGVDGIRTNACCADPTGCELIKVAFDFDAHYVVASCVDPALDVHGADLAAWLDAEGDGLELHLDSLTPIFVSRSVFRRALRLRLVR
jgi:hypothetical protein